MVFSRGRGVFLYDRQGREYLDAGSGLWNVCCGLGHPRLLAAAHRQLDRLAFAPLFGAAHEPAIALAARLVALAPAGLSRAFLANTGSEAVELAVKVVRELGRRQGSARFAIVALERAYHGSTCAAGSLSDGGGGRGSWQPELPGVLRIPPPYCYRCPYGAAHPACSLRCAEELEELCRRHPGRIAALFLEPILGAGGVIVPPPGYFERITAICRRHGVLLVLDEVATGFGRTGEMFAARLFGVEPDILLLSKGIDGGYLPLAAALFREEVAAPFWQGGEPLDFGSTQAGNPVACAVALATIEVIEEEGLLANCRRMGRRLRQGLERIMGVSPHVGEVRGEGLMLGLELVGERQGRAPLPPRLNILLAAHLRDQGLLVHPSACGLSFFPALSIREAEVDRLLAVLEPVLTRIRFPALAGGAATARAPAPG